MVYIFNETFYFSIDFKKSKTTSGYSKRYSDAKIFLIHQSWCPTNGKLNFYFKLWKYLSLISYSFKYFPRRFLEFLSSWTWNLHQIDNNILAQITMWRLWRDVWCDVWIHYNHSYWTLRKLNKSAITNQLIDTWNNFEILLQPWKKKKYFIFFALFNLSKKFSNVPNLNWAQ